MPNTDKGPVPNGNQGSGTAVDPDDMTGLQIVFCRVGEMIGEGTFGRVYAGTTPPPGEKKVAIKFLKQELCGQNPEILKRFEREVSLAEKLAHENIASIITAGVHEATGRWYIVLEYVNGEPLDALLDRYRDGLPIAMAAAIITQVLRAIKHAHEKDVVHRDLKPENIMVKVYADDHLFVKVLDFGVAHTTDPTITGGEKLTMERALIGTPHYMAPEVAMGLPDIDARSDLYSIGIILYEMLTGRPPFEAGTPMEVVTMQIRDEPARLSTKRSGIPRKLEDLVMWLLQKGKEKRPKTALETIRALEGAMHGFRESMARTMVPTMVQDPRDVSSMLATVQKDSHHAPTEFVRTLVKRPGVRRAGLGIAMAAALALVMSSVDWSGRPRQGGAPSATDPPRQGEARDRAANRRKASAPRETAGSSEHRVTESGDATRPQTAADSDTARAGLRDECLTALRAQRGFAGPCNRYLVLAPDDDFVRTTSTFLRRRGKR